MSSVISANLKRPANDATGYRVGDRDTRPWGTWEVLDAGVSGTEDYCVKKIVVNPSGILSLQSHELRREQWTVLSGVLTVTFNDEVFDVPAGETVHIPAHTKHRMANRTATPVSVLEIQRGHCQESDIIRYEDAYGRK